MYFILQRNYATTFIYQDNTKRNLTVLWLFEVLNSLGESMFQLPQIAPVCSLMAKSSSVLLKKLPDTPASENLTPKFNQRQQKVLQLQKGFGVFFRESIL